MNIKYFKFSLIFLLGFTLQSCMATLPKNPDNICLIFEEKKSWYKAVMQSEKRWKIPPYVLMSFVYQESSFQSDAKPKRTKLLWVIPWKRESTAAGYSQALNMTWEDYKEETGNTRANRKDFKDSADFIGWYASKGYYQGFDRLDARSLYLAYHEGYGGFKKKTYRKKPWLIKVADRVQARSTKYQQQYWGCAKELKKNRFFFF
ncbi:MAG: transglycosylase SLT domain-containing protein [Proteobacteria bacterium]|nr:transglycosylase SLT domain-containing protein [Pseudomonadota bacterium]MDA0949583.1 transglycosylase SLT domain-containing protein [Pseudomonadota bacterium]MDA1083380.1 transglycosylase SLT domain-containing protein [Pseudomonadota bacterium]